MSGKVRIFAGALALAASVACGQGGAPGGVNAPSGSDEIINGTVVQDGDPVLKSTVGLIALRPDGSHAGCTGTLLSDKVVLTAAHCVDGDPERIGVVFGRDYGNAGAENLRAGVTYVQHQNWKKGDPSARGDLALILFRGGLPEGYAPAEMVPPDASLEQGEDVIVTGFGVEDGTTLHGAGILRRTTMKVLGMESATEVVTDGHQRSVCFGDSGGPSYIERNQRFYIWGVASAVSNATCTEYAIHTDISSYEAWIQDLAARLTKDAGDLEAKAAAAAAATRQPSALVKADIASH